MYQSNLLFLLRRLQFSTISLKCEAKKISWVTYHEERVFVPALPKDVKIWDLDYFAQNGLGVEALDQGKLTGFLYYFSPLSKAFDTKDSSGTFSPLHSNVAVKKNWGQTLILNRGKDSSPCEAVHWTERSEGSG